MQHLTGSESATSGADFAVAHRDRAQQPVEFSPSPPQGLLGRRRLAPVAMLALQRTAGNRAVALAVQRADRPWITSTADSIGKLLLSKDPQLGFNQMNSLSLEDMIDTYRALSPEARAAAVTHWSMTGAGDVPRFTLTRNVVEAGAAATALTPSVVRAHHVIRGEMWPDAWALFVGLSTAQLNPVLKMLDVLHLRTLLAHADVGIDGLDRVRIVTAMSMFTTVEDAAGKLSDADLADVMHRHEIERIAQISNAEKGKNSGVWYPYAYSSQFPKEYAALPDAKGGYASKEFFERISHMHWRVLPKVSASAALKAWLAGLTIAECATVMTVTMYDSLLAAIGPRKFDKTFGDVEGTVARDQLMRISAGPEIPDPAAPDHVPSLRQFIDDQPHGAVLGGVPGSRSVKKGNWYYFRNHPDYTKKHPGGWLAGENTLCIDDVPGQQKFSGFGRTMVAVTEMEMLTLACKAYNPPQSPEEKKKGGSGFPEKVTEKDIVDAGGGIMSSKDVMVGVYDFDMRRVRSEIAKKN